MASSIRKNIAPTTGRRALALFTVLTAQFMLSMDLLIVVVALPRIIPSAISGLPIPRRYSHGD